MISLKTIRRRISSTKSTQKLTRAMKMISTARLRRARERSANASKYFNETFRLLRNIYEHNEDIAHPLTEKGEGDRSAAAVIVISSDKGLCGTFNENLFKFIGKQSEALRNNGLSLDYYALGRKGRDFLNRTGVPLKKELVNSNESESDKFLVDITVEIIADFLGGRISSAYVFYNKLAGSSSVSCDMMQLVPIRLDNKKRRYQIDYIYEPSASAIFDMLARNAVSSMIHAAYRESITAELTARMIAMENATNNADELIKKLTIDLNRARQTAITTELIDIVGGAEALK